MRSSTAESYVYFFFRSRADVHEMLVLFHLKPWHQHSAGWPEFNVAVWRVWPRNINTHKKKSSGAVPEATREARLLLLNTRGRRFQRREGGARVRSEQPVVPLVRSPSGSHGDSGVCFAPRNVSVPSVFRKTAAAATSPCQMMESRRTERAFMRKNCGAAVLRRLLGITGSLARSLAE